LHVASNVASKNPRKGKEDRPFCLGQQQLQKCRTCHILQIFSPPHNSDCPHLLQPAHTIAPHPHSHHFSVNLDLILSQYNIKSAHYPKTLMSGYATAQCQNPPAYHMNNVYCENLKPYITRNKQTNSNVTAAPLSPGYTRDWLPAYSFVLRARAMVLTGQRTLSDMSRARQ